MSIELKLELSLTEIVNQIEQSVKDKNLSYIEAIVECCEQKNLEIESVAQLIKKNQVLKSKIQVEAENLNFIPKSSRLPI